MSERVRVEAKVTTEIVVFLTEDEYERWQNGERAAGDYLADQLEDAARDGEGDGSRIVTIERAVLVEDDGYLGTEIATLKKF